MATVTSMKSYNACPVCGLWHDVTVPCSECLKPAVVRCHRCGEERQCSTWEHIALCIDCVTLILREWAIKRQEIGQLTEAQR